MIRARQRWNAQILKLLKEVYVIKFCFSSYLDFIITLSGLNNILIKNTAYCDTGLTSRAFLQIMLLSTVR
jgi:hypothetical protein